MRSRRAEQFPAPNALCAVGNYARWHPHAGPREPIAQTAGPRRVADDVKGGSWWRLSQNRIAIHPISGKEVVAFAKMSGRQRSCPAFGER